jgi:hypothetical protein
MNIVTWKKYKKDNIIDDWNEMTAYLSKIGFEDLGNYCRSVDEPTLRDKVEKVVGEREFEIVVYEQKGRGKFSSSIFIFAKPLATQI